MSQYKSALEFGYANARVRAMRSRLLKEEMVKEILGAESTSGIIGELLQTSYRKELDEFAGESIKENMVDFALKRNLERSVEEVIRITPRHYKKTMLTLLSKNDYQTIKIVINAKQNGYSFERISRLLIPSSVIGEKRIKAAFECATIEESAHALADGTIYSEIVEGAMAAYRKSTNIIDFELAIDKGSYASIHSQASKLRSNDINMARIISLDIEMRNVMTALRAKHANIPEEQLQSLLILGGITQISAILDAYRSAKDTLELAAGIKSFDLSKANEVGESARQRMLGFETSMRKQFLKRCMMLLGSSMLSLGSLMVYFYMKSAEVSSLRNIANGKSYGIDSALYSDK